MPVATPARTMCSAARAKSLLQPAHAARAMLPDGHPATGPAGIPGNPTPTPVPPTRYGPFAAAHPTLETVSQVQKLADGLWNVHAGPIPEVRVGQAPAGGVPSQEPAVVKHVDRTLLAGASSHSGRPELAWSFAATKSGLFMRCEKA